MIIKSNHISITTHKSSPWEVK